MSYHFYHILPELSQHYLLPMLVDFKHFCTHFFYCNIWPSLQTTSLYIQSQMAFQILLKNEIIQSSVLNSSNCFNHRIKFTFTTAYSFGELNSQNFHLPSNSSSRCIRHIGLIILQILHACSCKGTRDYYYIHCNIT